MTDAGELPISDIRAISVPESLQFVDLFRNMLKDAEDRIIREIERKDGEQKDRQQEKWDGFDRRFKPLEAHLEAENDRAERAEARIGPWRTLLHLVNKYWLQILFTITTLAVLIHEFAK